MSTPTKLRGGSASELTKLKDIWRRLDESARDYWRSRFCSPDTQAVLRAELLKKLKVNLTRDNQLTEFRSWDDANQQRELMAEKIEERKQELLAGGMTLDEAQQVLLTEAAAYSTAARDFNLGVKVSRAISNTKRDGLEERRITMLEKKADAYDRAQAALSEAKKSKGGITPETLTRIEQELRLL
jgi:hypothetical protein